jgi:hypothetical protein
MAKIYEERGMDVSHREAALLMSLKDGFISFTSDIVAMLVHATPEVAPPVRCCSIEQGSNDSTTTKVKVKVKAKVEVKVRVKVKVKVKVEVKVKVMVKVMVKVNVKLKVKEKVK